MWINDVSAFISDQAPWPRCLDYYRLVNKADRMSWFVSCSPLLPVAYCLSPAAEHHPWSLNLPGFWQCMRQNPMSNQSWSRWRIEDLGRSVSFFETGSLVHQTLHLHCKYLHNYYGTASSYECLSLLKLIPLHHPKLFWSQTKMIYKIYIAISPGAVFIVSHFALHLRMPNW